MICEILSSVHDHDCSHFFSIRISNRRSTSFCSCLIGPRVRERWLEPAGLLPLLLLWRIPIRLPPSGLSKHPSDYFYRILLLAFANKIQVLGRLQRFSPGSLPNFLEFHFKTLKSPIGLIWASMNLIKCLLIQVCRRWTFGQVICQLDVSRLPY